MSSSIFPAAVMLSTLLAAASTSTGSQSMQETARAVSERCFSCHGEPGGQAPTIDPDALRSSVHARLECTACHVGVIPVHGPDLPEARCDSCHGDESEGFRRGVHWKERSRGNPAAPSCARCHGAHGIRPAGSDASPVSRANEARTCGACHPEALRLYERSVHHEAMSSAELRELAPTCTTCHGEHEILGARAPASPSSSLRLPRTCGGCHDDPRTAAKAGAPASRLGTYSISVHGQRNAFGVASVADCADCHGAHLVLPQSDPASSISKENLVATCGKCHEGATENFAMAKVHVDADADSPGVLAVRWFYIVFIGILVLGFITHMSLEVLSRLRRREANNG